MKNADKLKNKIQKIRLSSLRLNERKLKEVTKAHKRVVEKYIPLLNKAFREEQYSIQQLRAEVGDAKADQFIKSLF